MKFRTLLLLPFAALTSQTWGAGTAPQESVDLSHAVVVAGTGMGSPVEKAVLMLIDEVRMRTQIRWVRTDERPTNTTAIIELGMGPRLFRPNDSDRDGYEIRTERSPIPTIRVSGNSSRGILFGIGRLLRELRMDRQRVTLPANFNTNSTPKMPLRGHQLGYRPKCNSYDAWTVPMWEQYIRDLVVFGCNAIELIPPRSDDDDDSPHFPLPQMEMMIEMSRLADEYGLDVWIWYPAMDKDYSDPKTVEFALQEWGDVFKKLPRVDAVFVPGGDPGHTQPRHLLALLEKQTENLHRYHPRAAMWVSPQSFTKAWMDEFLELMKAEPRWLTGIAYGPQVRMPLANLRAAVPKRYPIRDYPDITHSRHCQYPVPDWDLAYAVTEGRECINPRPTQMASIFRATTLTNTIGFITYSEGCNDDVNKAIWSALGWDPNADMHEALRQYARYFIGGPRSDEFADGLLALEANWRGTVLTNSAIDSTFEKFRALEKAASPQQKLNWRFQQALYRAYYDAYVRKRLIRETETDVKTLRALGEAIDARKETSATIDEAEHVLDGVASSPSPLNAERAGVRGETVHELQLRARLFELAEALFQSIRMQLSVERYDGVRGRGSNLDEIDQPLSNRQWLKHRLAEIRKVKGPAEQRRALAEIVSWADPGPGGFYDDLGDPNRQPHLVRGLGWQKDPGFYATPQVGFTEHSYQGVPLPRTWWTTAESFYDSPLKMHYSGLDKSAHYRLRVVYGRYRGSGEVRLLANDSIEIHPWMERPAEKLEFDIPREATAKGELTLTWLPEPSRGGNGRGTEVAEVWLIRK